VIGAVNTIVPTPNEPGKPPRLVGENTDWLGMTHSLVSASYSPISSGTPGSALVIGAGGTARAAIYALQSLAHTPIYIVSRTPSKLSAMIATFPAEFNIIPLTELSAVENMLDVPRVAIGTIPADKPIEQNMREILANILRHPKLNSAQQRTLLEMAYKPSQTALMQMAKDAGWVTIPGLEVLSAQGWYQVSNGETSRIFSITNNLYCSSRNGLASSPCMTMQELLSWETMCCNGYPVR
jgi:pentafunctional AROM polypeptide